jgi:hypothetical protein
MNAVAENILDAASAEQTAAKAVTDQANAVAGHKPASAAQGISFSYDEAAAEALFGARGEDGRPANIPSKYWDAGNRKVKADVVFNQLRWAEGKLGKKLEVIGGPADGTEYKVNLPPPQEGKLPFEIPADDPGVTGFLAVARKHDVSQAFVDEVVAEVVRLADERGSTSFKAEVEKLGKDAQQRVQDMRQFLSANLSEEDQATITGFLTSAAAFDAIESLVRATGAPAFVQRDAQGVAPSGAMSVEQWNALNFEMVDQGGRKERRRAVDPAFDRMVAEKAKEVFGETRRDASMRPVSESGRPL